MKLCKDCKHGPKRFEIGSLGAGYTSYCTHPAAPVDPVFGGKNGSFQLMRANCVISYCGPDAEWFEPANLDGESK